MTDLVTLRGRARHAYEAGRAKRAAWTSLPLGAVAVVAWLLGTPSGVALALGALTVTLAFALLHAGGAGSRLVFPGVGAGLVPFALMHVAHVAGPSCTTMASCDQMCLAACGLGGLAAGVIVVRAALRTTRPALAVAAGGALAAAVGSLGCACIGLLGVGAVAAGLALAALPTLAVARAR